jgi:hypothetical protein
MVAPSGRGGLVSFRLGDVPEEVRLRALERLLRGADPKLPAAISFSDRVQLGLVAERPSDRVYWIPRPAYERVMLRKRRKRR